MAKILIEIDDLYADAMMQQATDNGEPRNQMIVEALMKAVDSIPGLLDRVKASRSGEYRADFSPKFESGRKGMFDDDLPLKQRMKRYRFKPRDGGPIIEGIGVAAGDALTDATGRKWTQPEFAKEYMDPEMVGYVDEEDGV